MLVIFKSPASLKCSTPSAVQLDTAETQLPSPEACATSNSSPCIMEEKSSLVCCHFEGQANNQPSLDFKFHTLTAKVRLGKHLEVFSSRFLLTAGPTSSWISFLGASCSQGFEEHLGWWPLCSVKGAAGHFQRTGAWEGIKTQSEMMEGWRTTASKVRMSAPEFNPCPAAVS